MLKFELPWDSQPQEVVGVNPYWVDRGLIYAWDGNATAWSAWDSSAPLSKTGTPTPLAGAYGISSEFTAGSNDAILSQNIRSTAPVETILTFQKFASGYTATTACRVFQEDGTAGLQAESLWTVGTPLYYQRPGTGGSLYTQYEIDATPTVDVWTSYAVVHDLSAPTNNPLIYKNGVYKDSPSPFGGGVSAFTRPAYRMLHGNRSTDYARPFVGVLGPLFLFDTLLTGSEIATLHSNPWQLFAPRSIWIPVSAGGGGTTISGALGTATASGITGTVDANRTIAGSVGVASALGIQGGVSQSSDTTVTGTVGVATASGIAGGVDANRTIAGVVGVATAEGLQGTVSNDNNTVVTGSVGTATASGVAGAVAWNRTLAGIVGEAIASGITGGVQSGDAITQLLGIGGWGPIRRRKHKDDDDKPQELPEVVEPVAPKPRKTLKLADIIGKRAQISSVDISGAVAASKKRKRQQEDELLLLM